MNKIKILKALNVSASKINFDDIPMIISPENNNIQEKHYYFYCRDNPESKYFYDKTSPKNYYILNLSEHLKYYIESRNPNLTLSDMFETLEDDFNFYTNITIEEMQEDAILQRTWITFNHRCGWYYFDENYDIIDDIFIKYYNICSINIFKNELLEKRDIMMLHPKWVNKLLESKNINFYELDPEDL